LQEKEKFVGKRGKEGGKAKGRKRRKGGWGFRKKNWGVKK